ncbi:MAG: hypothetical protein ACXVAX_04765 [Pseudobdellovibrio sp.]
MLKNLWMTLPLCLLGLTSFASTAPAVPAPTSATSTTTPMKDDVASLKFNLGLGAAYSTQAQTQPDGTRSEEVDYIFTPALTYGDYKFSMFNLYAQNMKDTTKGGGGSFIDPIYSISKKSMALGEYFKWGPSLSFVLPMTDNSKNNTQLLYTIGGAVSIALNTKNLGIDAWSISYSVGVNRNFTQFDTTAAGDPVTAERIRQRFNVGYDFTDSWSLATRFEFDANYTYDGIVRNRFLHYETLNYKFNDTVSVSAGHTNSNTLLNGTTYENNLKFYDDATSQYTAELDISI